MKRIFPILLIAAALVAALGSAAGGADVGVQREADC
jgi:hypothetical protein